MNVSLVRFTPEPMGNIESAAAYCYDSKPTPNFKIAKNCIRCGHDSVTEHSMFTFEVEGISRACLAQVTRHRVGTAFSVRSQRYCNESEVAFVLPKTIANNPAAVVRYTEALNKLQAVYTELLADGVPTEDARYILPNATETKLALSFNVRALVHFCNLRLCTRAQWEIRELAEKLRDAVVMVCPDLQDWLVPTCKKLGYCPERRGCGRSMTLRELLAAAESKGYFEAYAEANGGAK